VTEEEQAAATDKTCLYLEDAFKSGFFYRTDISVTNYSCTDVAIDGNSPLSIQFDITATVSKWDGFNPYTNRLLPDQEEIEGLIRQVVEFGRTRAPGDRDSLLTVLKNELSSPYSASTALSIL